MAKKRTKADKLQRSTERVEKRDDALPEESETKGTREDVNQAAARTVRAATGKSG
ncbi:MAG: hypothetical protein LAN37_10115 [Acidobacteriia bacterium]|nr:hypothetical protein [Terriglobia bacterium]